MSYGSEGYLSVHRDNEKVAHLIRSVVQDGCRELQQKTLDTIFIEKIIDGVDIGKICSDLVIRISGSLKDYESEKDDIEEKETITDLLMIVYIDYLEGINPNKDIVWQLEWIGKGIPLFGKKINTLPGTGKISPMASLEKPKSKKEDGIDFKNIGW